MLKLVIQFPLVDSADSPMWLCYEKNIHASSISKSPPSVQGFVWNRPEWKQTQPLPEDFTLRGLALLENFHLQLEFDTSYGLSSKEECLHNFGQLLAGLPKTGVNFNSEKECFTASNTEKTFSGAGVEQPVGQRKQMMWKMAHLWLKAEVNDLESKVKGGGFPQLSPYLVPDISSFCQHLALLKQLRLSKRFVIVVPSVTSLDERKKESVGAREAIRWLENELRHGTRQRLVSRPRMFKLRAVVRILKTRQMRLAVKIGRLLSGNIF
ncbi:nonsense-mediated mRNA decay factor SMG5-like isoform X9 [Tachypleus tridentatus]|uniref:nonsense-mediated mRNA decay factor SMG5-like isoform X9 n=1 Tax=Tachypleus tridentatus TaxID=6853 RepID=UPI003FD06F20